MMITWQFENAFQNLGEYSKASISPGFEGQQSGDQSSQRDFEGGGGRLKKLALEDICHSVAFLKSRQGKKEGGGNKNITVLWGIILLLSRHNQNPL